MACNTGKFIDRSPIICPAGKIFGKEDDTAEGCFKQYPLQDQVDALKHQAGIFQDEPQISYKLPPLRSHRHVGIFTESRPVIRPAVQTRFQTLINDLKETSYDSYWNKTLGKCRDSGSGLPAHIDPLTTTFGAPSKKETTVKELVNPPKGPYQVLRENQVGHEMYKKTHNDYNPSERINRNYLQPAYDPKKCYGIHTSYDPRGIWVKCICHGQNNEPAITTNIIQADAFNKNKPRLGKCMTPNDNIKRVPEGHTFGKPCKRELYGIEELLRGDSPPCLFKRDFYDWLDSLNHLRRILKKKNVFHFDMRHFHQRIVNYDKEHTGWISKQLLYDLCRFYHVNFEPKALEPLFALLGILRDDKMHYPSFIDLIDLNKEMPEIFKIQDIPPENVHFITTNQAAMCDYLIMNNTDAPVAGLPSQRFDLPRPKVPFGQCAADRDNLGDETTVEALINPNIYTSYGLSHRDFCMPRKKESIRNLFEKVGYKLADEEFEKLWKKASDIDKTGLVCVNTFDKLIKEREM